MSVQGRWAQLMFAFTVFFDPAEAPVNHDLFGPAFAFTGELVSGEITVVDPSAWVRLIPADARGGDAAVPRRFAALASRRGRR